MIAAIRHLIGSTRFSIQGLGVLMRERAARIEVFALAVSLVYLALLGARAGHWVMVTVLFLVLLGTEALNTCIEALVDRDSLERSDFARDVKDLGSAAVFCTVCGLIVYLAAVGFGALGWIAF